MLRRWDVRAIMLSVVLGLSLAAVAQEQPQATAPSRQNLADRLNRFSRAAQPTDLNEAAEAPRPSAVRHADFSSTDDTRVIPTAETDPPEPRTAGRSSRRTARPAIPQQQRSYAAPAQTAEGNSVSPGADTQSPASSDRREPTTARREPTLAKPRTKTAKNEPTLAPPREATKAPNLGDPAGASSDPELTAPVDPMPPMPAAGTSADPSETPNSSRAAKSRSLQDRLSRVRKAEPAPANVAPALPENVEPAPAAVEPSVETPAAPASEPQPRTTPRTARIERPSLAGPHDSLAVPPLDRRGSDDMRVVHQSPLLGVETSGPRKIKVNEPATYHVTARNAGQGTAQNVVVTVRLPEWADVVGSHTQLGAVQVPVAGSGEGVQWHLDELAGSSQAEMTLDIVPRKSRPFDLAVQWTHSPVSANAMVEVQEAKLLMALSGPDEVYFGEQEVYKLTLSNPGTGDAENVVVRLLPNVPGEATAASHDIGVIPAGHTKVVELELTARDPGRLTINAEATASGGLQAQVSEEILVRRAELDVKLAGPKSQYAGTVATYAVTVSNPGNAVAKNVEVAFMLPSSATYVSDNGGGHLEAKGTKVVWRLPNLRPETPQKFEIKCKLEAPGANHPQVACMAEGDLRDTGTLVTHVEALADLRLEVFDPQGPVMVGSDVEYEIHVKNRGSKAAENVEVVAFFSDGVEPVATAGDGHELGVGQVAFAPLVSIAGGQEEVLKVTARGQTAGNHMIRVQLRCQPLNTMLTQEETTLYYQPDQDVIEETAAAPSDGYEAEADPNWQPDPDGQTLPEDTE